MTQQGVALPSDVIALSVTQITMRVIESAGISLLHRKQAEMRRAINRRV